MARYRKIDVRIWNDAKFRGLSDRGKLAFLFLLTHPNMTSLGAMRATVPGLASELEWPEKAFREAFREALSKGMAKHDETACFVGLPNFIKYNPPESPNVVKNWAECVDLIPECEAKDVLLQHVKDLMQGFSEGFLKALGEALPKGMPNHEHEHEHKHKHEFLGEPAPPKTKFAPPSVDEVRGYCQERSNTIDPQAFVDYYAARGWMLGKVKMKDWRAAVHTWEKNQKQSTPAKEEFWMPKATRREPAQ